MIEVLSFLNRHQMLLVLATPVLSVVSFFVYLACTGASESDYGVGIIIVAPLIIIVVGITGAGLFQIPGFILKKVGQ